MCAHAEIKGSLQGHYVVMDQDILFSASPHPPPPLLRCKLALLKLVHKPSFFPL